MIRFSLNLTEHSRRCNIALKLLALARCDDVDLLSMLTPLMAYLNGALLAQNSDRRVRSESLKGQISIPGRFFTNQSNVKIRQSGDFILRLLSIFCWPFIEVKLIPPFSKILGLSHCLVARLLTYLRHPYWSASLLDFQIPIPLFFLRRVAMHGSDASYSFFGQGQG
jgi:hypothetical protein